MYKRLIYVMAAMILPLVAVSQSSLNSVLISVENNSTQLKAARSKADAGAAEARIGLSPQDPVVSYGYFPGSNPLIGDKQMMSISQELDFPLLYHTRKKMADKRRLLSDITYRQKRQEVLLRAKNEWNRFVFLTKRYAIMQERLERGRRLLSVTEVSMQVGEISSIDLNKARTNFSTLQARLVLLKQEMDLSLSILEQMNGGKPVEVSDTSYAEEIIPALNVLFEELIAKHPAVAIAAERVSYANLNKKFSSQQHLPDLHIAYQREIEKDGNYSGFSGGISLPLWNNNGANAYARAMQDMTYDDEANLLIQLRSETEQNYKAAMELASLRSELGGQSKVSQQEILLLKAFDAGEISIGQYIIELSYLYESSDLLLELDYKYYALLAKLTAFQL